MTKSNYLPDIRVEVAFGSGFSTAAASRTWTDVTDYVEFDRSIGIQRGRGDELSDVDASQLTLVLNNRDGRFTAGLSSSAYYPNVKLMTPIRVRVAQNYLSANAASMETSIASWSAGGTVPPTLSQSAVRAYDGTKSLLVTWGTGGSLPLAQTTLSGLTIGQTYTMSAWVWVPSGSPHVQCAVAGLGTGDATTLRDQWVPISKSFTATATSHLTQVWPASSPTSGQQVWVDAVMVSDGSDATAFTILDSPAATRFVGYVTRWPVEWNGTDADAWATVTASSRTARLGRSNPLDNVLAADILADKPSVYYKLDGLIETLGGDSLAQAGSGAAVTFDGTGPSVDGISAAQFSGGKSLRGPVSFAVDTAVSDYWLECTFLTVAASPVAIVSVEDASKNSLGQIGLEGDGTLSFGAGTANQASTNVWNNGATHHALITISATTKVRLYVDGVLDGTTVAAPSLNAAAASVAIGDFSDFGGAFTGTISNVAFGAGTLTAADIAARAALITGTYDGETAADRVERYAGIAGIPTAEVSADAAAVTPMLHVDTTGQSVSDLLKMVATTEGGQVFDARDGTLTYRSRNARYNTTAGLTLNIATGMVEADVQPVYDDQALVNDSTATIIAVGEGEATVAGRTIDQDSVDAYGPYKQDVEVATSDVNDAAGAAGWLVNTHSEPATRIASLTTDVVQLDPATQADALEADIATRVAVTNWPAQVGSTYANGFFVEGYTETISPESWVITYNVSPADHYDVFTLDHADRGDLDSIYPLAW